MPAVDAKHVGIEGVSRYGKAALVTMAFEPRFAMVLVGSSGEGGAKLHRRNFGEAVENLTGSGEYHWMAGNFLKYGAAESTFGSKNAGDLPVDAHELIALCAPRPTFISYGIPEKGDANWLDQQGSYMATVAAGPVFRLLGAKDIGVTDDYRTAKMPPVNTGLLDGELAWRQHDGGHDDRSELELLHRRGPTGSSAHSDAAGIDRSRRRSRPTMPVARTDQNSHDRARSSCWRRRRAAASTSTSSATRSPAAGARPTIRTSSPTGRQNFYGWNAADFGWGGDRTQNILWRLENGELDGVNPKVIVLLAGTNNVGERRRRRRQGGRRHPRRRRRSSTRAARRRPRATIILTAHLPAQRQHGRACPTIDRINANLAKLADGKAIRFLNVNDKLADSDGHARSTA